jgi:DNA-binding protein HU-beta
MTKAELVAEIQNNLGDASKADAEKALSAVLSSIKPAVAVQLVGFGTFSVTRRNARSGINPLTKAPLKIKASKAVKFKVGAGLKDQL